MNENQEEGMKLPMAGRGLFERGERITVMGREAIVKRIDSDTTLTIAWRDAWYWRVMDAIRRTVRRLWKAVRPV